MSERRSKHVGVTFAGACLVLALALGLSSPAAAEYRVQAGDVIEVSVTGLPELHQRLQVQLDGSIAIPVVGALMVEGGSMADVRNSIQSAFASRLLTLSRSDGSEVMLTVERQDVAVAIAEYRPIWVSGDVARPSQQPFYPRMSVRQAIASAGGLRPPIACAAGSSDDPVTLHDDYVAKWLNLAGQAVRLWRLRSELGDASNFDPNTIPRSPVAAEILTRIIDTEGKLKNLRQLDYDREKQFFERSAVLAGEQIASLSQQLEMEEQGEVDAQAEYDRAQELLAKGKLINSRVVEARRAVLFSATRKLQTANDLMQTRRRLAEIQRELEKLEDRRRIAILEELQTTELKLADARTRLRSVEDKLRMAGSGPDLPDTAAITLVRRTTDGPRTIAASYEDEVMPGDVITVEWRRGAAPALDDVSVMGSEQWMDASRTN